MEHAPNNPSAKKHLHRWELGLVATAAAVIATPYVLPLIGIGDTALATRISAICGTSQGGLAQAVEGVLGKVPVAGAMLASAGWGASITSGVIGIAGTLLGDYIHRHYDRKGHIQWGTIIKYAALTTSVLIALPSILSGISMGLTFLANAGVSLFGSSADGFAAGEWMRKLLEPTIGFSGVAHNAPTGLAGLAPHLFTCGRALLPAGLTFFAAHKSKAHGSASEGNYTVQMASPPCPMKGKPCEVTFQLTDSDTGRPLSDAELSVVHTRPLHTMIIDSSLRDYHHLHPTYDPARKLFVCQFTPQLQGNYAMWNDFTVKGEAQPTHIKTELGALRGLCLPTRVEHASSAMGDGLSVHLGSDQRLRANSEAMISVDMRDAAGRPVVDLEPIMGAYAHLVGFSADGKHFIHTHPMGSEPQSASARGASPLHFHVTLPDCSDVKFFLQIQRAGKIHTFPFGQKLARNPSFTALVQPTTPTHMGAAIA